MRRLLSGGLVVFAGVVSPVVVSHRQASAVLPSDHHKDARFEALRKFFHKADCPAQEYSDVFIEAADRYELDWRLLPSLSYVESTGGKQARNNNLFGWDSGRAQFASPIEGIHQVGYRLANSNLYRDKSLDELLETYNPSAEYAQKVKSVMRRIAPEE
jgi:hypothetical protein